MPPAGAVTREPRLPGNRAVLVLEGPGRPAGAEGGQPDGDDGGLLDTPVAPVIVEMGGGEAGVGGADLDRGLPQFLGVGDGEGVLGGFRGLVRDEETSVPCSLSCRAISKPMPLLAPVMSAIFSPAIS